MNQPSVTPATYNATVVRQFSLMAVVWGVVGMLVGVFIAAQLAWPELNMGIPGLSYGRLRPLHTNAVIFAFGLDAIELASPDGPAQGAEDDQRQHHRQRDEEEQDVHQETCGSRARRAALRTTNRELAAMPRPASHGGIMPAMASGTQTAL